MAILSNPNTQNMWENRMKRNQSGFTLIEIAIVLVIIGLLLGGVMKGQELINSAKVKNFATDFKNIPVYIYGYQDKFRALPGDDPRAVSHVSAATGHNGDGNGMLTGAWDSSTNTAETQMFWEHIRLAGLAPGPTSGSDLLPTNSAGGIIGITGAASSPVSGMNGTYVICSNSILGKFAKQLDTQMDDGDTETGSMRVISTPSTRGSGAGSTTAASAVTLANTLDSTSFTVCMGF
jgi:prepilin-type N-terminal cleavage/methylation domain-containing protein